MRVEAIRSLTRGTLTAQALCGVIINLTALRVNKKAALSFALPPEAANGAIGIFIDPSTGRMGVRALRVFARTAILALDSTCAFPRELFTCGIRRYRVTSFWGGIGGWRWFRRWRCSRCHGPGDHGQKPWVWHQQQLLWWCQGASFPQTWDECRWFHHSCLQGWWWRHRGRHPRHHTRHRHRFGT